MARKRTNFTRGWSAIDRMTDDNQMTIYDGQEMTKAQARAKKAAKTRAENAQKKQKHSEYVKKTILPDLLTEVKKTMKSVRNLKTICAFHDNGPVQWCRPYKEMMLMFPEIESVLGKYHVHYTKVSDTVQKLNNMIKKNKTDKDFFGVAEQFGYQMWELLDLVKEVSDTISKSGVLDMRSFAGKEIIESSADGRRPGLKHIMRNTYSTVSTTEKNIVSLGVSLRQAYDELVEYNFNGKRVY